MDTICRMLNETSLDVIQWVLFAEIELGYQINEKLVPIFGIFGFSRLQRSRRTQCLSFWCAFTNRSRSTKTLIGEIQPVVKARIELNYSRNLIWKKKFSGPFRFLSFPLLDRIFVMIDIKSPKSGTLVIDTLQDAFQPKVGAKNDIEEIEKSILRGISCIRQLIKLQSEDKRSALVRVKKSFTLKNLLYGTLMVTVARMNQFLR